MATAASEPSQPVAESTYPYDKLDVLEMEFRLLRIVPSTEDGRPRCQLQTHALHAESLTWKALSYQWGNDDATEAISLNDRDFYVRPNLYGFLEQMARRGEDSWIFVDAICINQSDIDERSQQVRLMRNIYKDAEEVMVWISLDAQSRRLFEQYSGEAIAIKVANGDKLKKEERDCITIAKSTILRNSFWSRVWVVQEVLLASKLTFFVGPLIFTESDIFRVNADEPLSHQDDGMMALVATDIANQKISTQLQISTKHLHQLQVLERLYQFSSIRSLRARRGDQLRNGELSPLFDALATCSTKGCKIIHDKVYALLSISNTHILPDYSLPLVYVIIDVLADSFVSYNSEEGFVGSKSLRAALPHLGTAFSQAFNVGLMDPLLFLLMHEVAILVSPPEQVIELHELFTRDECFRRIMSLSDNGKAKQARKWYETKGTAMKRYIRENEDKFHKAQKKLDEDKRQDNPIPSPWKTSDGLEDVRRYTDWAELVRARVKAIELRDVAKREQRLSEQKRDVDVWETAVAW